MGVLADAGDELYKELWHACAGPLVTVPRQGDLVFYFPQGHIEQVMNLDSCLVYSFSFLGSFMFTYLCPRFLLIQVEASTNQVSNQQMPAYDLSPKILCRVVNVQLKVLIQFHNFCVKHAALLNLDWM